MKTLQTFVLFALSSIVEGNVWAAARNLAQPIILSVGTIFATISLDKQPLPDISFLKETSRPRGRPRKKEKEEDKKVVTEPVKPVRPVKEVKEVKEVVKKERKARKRHEFKKLRAG